MFTKYSSSLRATGKMELLQVLWGKKRGLGMHLKLCMHSRQFSVVV